MADTKIILVTGVADDWGARLAARLVDEPGVHVIGLDTRPPQEVIKNLDFIQAAIRNPLLVELLRAESVDTVCHLAFTESERRTESAFETNVIDTMKMLAACAEAGVRKVVLKSSTMVYGARPDNSSFLTEDSPLHGHPRAGTVRDLVEIEAFCNSFARQTPGLILSLLRFPGIIGPRTDTPLTRFLRTPWSPTLLGFDPMMQLIHEDDVIEALAHAANDDLPGIFNVAAEGLLPMGQLMRLAGKLPIPVFHLTAYWATNLLGSSRLPVSRCAPIELDYIRYPWVADLDKMREEFGFTPRYTAVDALREFAGQRRLDRYLPAETVNAEEERLRDTLERRRQAREREARLTQAFAAIEEMDHA
jgi:UDP-glucose 4-epimerase